MLVQYQLVPDEVLVTPLGGDVSNPLSSFTSLTVEGLVTGEEYQFRVTASNVLGSDIIVLPTYYWLASEGGGGRGRGRERKESERGTGKR